MLIKEEDRKYFIYPTWAEDQLSYKWRELPGKLGDPFKHNETLRVNNTMDDLIRYGYPPEVQRYDLIDGPVGGGIVVAHIKYLEKWLPATLLVMEANLCLPSPMMDTKGQYNVCYIEPRDEPGWELGIGKQKKLYITNTSAEHIESTGDSIYWLISLKGKKRPFEYRDEIPKWSKEFGLNICRIDSPPVPTLQETGSWRPAGFEYLWYKVQDGGTGFGYHFAIMLYMSLHLGRVAGHQIRTMHLLAQIDQKPNPYSSGRRRIF